MFATMLKNWRTTVTGLGVLFTTVGNAIAEWKTGGIGAVNVTVLIAGLSMGFGLLFAKDSNVTGGTVQNALPAPK